MSVYMSEHDCLRIAGLAADIVDLVHGSGLPPLEGALAMFQATAMLGGLVNFEEKERKIDGPLFQMPHPSEPS